MKFSLTSCEIGPNFNCNDAKIALFSPFFSKSKKQKSKSQVLSFFKAKFSNHAEPKYFTRASRTGLFLLLKSLDLPEKSEIALQSFSCVVVPNSVLQAGLKPVILDVNPNTYNLDIHTLQKAWNPQIKVLIIQHAFGLSTDWTEVTDFCKQKKIIIIEDCAHSLGASLTVAGQSVVAGNIGQACFFSFGRDKIVSCTSGGLVLIKKEEELWIKNIDLAYSKLDETSYSESLRSLLYIWATTLIIVPFYGLFGKGLFWFLARLQLLGDVYTDEEKVGTSKLISAEKMHLNLFPVLDNQLAKIEILNQHRRLLAQFYSSELNIDYESGSVFLRFPVQVSKSAHKQITAALKKENILLGQWYLSPFIPLQSQASKFYYSKNNCPVVEDLIQEKVLNLPTNYNTSLETAARIIQIVRQFDKA